MTAHLPRGSWQSIILGGVLILTFWILDAVMDTVFFNPSGSFLDNLLRPAAGELWMRLLVSLLLALLSLFASLLLRRREIMANGHRRQHRRLEELAAKLHKYNQALKEEIDRRVKMEAQLAELAVTDPLTGTFNRRKFDESLEAELAREQRYPRGLALVILDIDHFKAVNDRLGHPTGDRVLRHLAALILEAKRDADRFFRIGGEEFAFLTYMPDDASLQAMAEKVRALVETADFPEAGHITISLGGSRYRADDTYRSLLRRSDEALYQAKAGGRNRVVIV